MALEKPTFDYEEESHSARLSRKSKDSPFMIVGLAGLITACAIGAYKFKTKGTMSTSVFLMQLRVAAQGTVVAALTAGLGYALFKDNFIKHEETKHE